VTFAVAGVAWSAGTGQNAEGLDQPIPKGYIYFAMAFSVGLELLNLLVRRAQTRAVQLRRPFAEDSGG
jgi:predicted tellurium resistance membrane protein TerC